MANIKVDMKSICCLLLMFLFIVIGIEATCENDKTSDPVVCIGKSSECIEGVRLPGFQKDCYEAFLGIPFAKPPVEELRFADPVPADKWEGVLQAKQAKSDCIQKNYLLPVRTISGKEDCLYLNVYRPMEATKKTLPVMVYIYGGGFFSGTANPFIHGPEYFMDTGEVILVTIAYRLGALGFLSTGDETCPGNFALKDQNLAFQWVKKNIEAFNGDPNSVTIFGQSAGGASVHLHMLSPLSAGLFHRAIVMSGSAAAPYSKIVTEPLKQAKQQAEYCGIENTNDLNNKDLINALRKVNASTIVEVGDKFKHWDVDPLITFRPVIEPNSASAFLTKDPNEIVRTGEFRHVPWMTGFVPIEGVIRAIIYTNETLRQSFNSNFDDLLINLMELPYEDKKVVDSILKEVVDFYMDGSHELNSNNFKRFVDMLSDRAFIHPLYKNVKNYVSYADLTKNPVYLYKFSYKGPYSYSGFFIGTTDDLGVVHCDDLIYLFRSPALFPNGFQPDSIYAQVIKDLVGAYVSFATKGNPTKDSSLKSCTKEALANSPTGICDYLEFTNSKDKSKGLKVETNNAFDMNAVEFWNKIEN